MWCYLKTKGGFKMDNLQEIKDSHKKALRTILEKIHKINENEECSNSNEKKRILVDTIPILNLTFKKIRDNFPKEVDNLLVMYPSSSRPAVQELEKILNKVGLCLFATSSQTFRITTIS